MITKHLTVSGLLSKLRGVPSLLLVMLTTWMMTPSPLSINAALAAPASWDYAYKYNATNDEFEFTRYDATASNTPVYTRTADSTYYNYTYTGSGNGTLPFEVTLTFNRSNTTWKSYGGGYTSDDTKIGSDVAIATINRISVRLNNNTNNNFYFMLDLSSILAGTASFTYKVNDYIVTNRSSLLYYIISTTTHLSYFFIPANSFITLDLAQETTARYFDAFYLQDLGVSASYTAGVDDTTTDIEQQLAQAYLNGYQEALDMQTAGALDNGTMIFIGFFVTALLMGVGFFTKAKIFNLLAIGGIVFFISQFTNVAMVILGVGLIIVNLIYTFYGWQRD